MKQLLVTRNDNARLLVRGQPKNCVRFNTGSNLVHEMEKARICFELQQMGHFFVSEAVFSSGGRADVFDLDTSTVLEILCSETEAQYNAKIKKYPTTVKCIKRRVTA